MFTVDVSSSGQWLSKFEGSVVGSHQQVLFCSSLFPDKHWNVLVSVAARRGAFCLTIFLHRASVCNAYVFYTHTYTHLRTGAYFYITKDLLLFEMYEFHSSFLACCIYGQE